MIRASDLNGEWEQKPLGKVAEFLDSQRKPVKEQDRIPGPYPYYGANGLQGSIDGYLFDGPAILLAEDGGHFGSESRTIAYQVDGRYWVNNHAHVLRPKNGDVDIRFLCRQLERYDVTPFITGTTRGKLTRGAADQIPIAVPPLAEQKRIAAILDKADEVRRKRQRAIELADEFLKSAFLEMFGDPVTNSKGWEVGTIRDLVAEVKYGTSKKADLANGKFPILRMNNITFEGTWDLSNLKYVDLALDEESKYLVRSGDLLFNRTNSKELVGKTGVYNGPEPMAYAGYLIRARTNERASPEYVSGYLNSHYGKTDLSHMCKSIVGMANINAQEFQDMRIMIPDIATQDRYAKVVRATRERIKRCQDELRCSDNLFNSLVQRAFRGELSAAEAGV